MCRLTTNAARRRPLTARSLIKAPWRIPQTWSPKQGAAIKAPTISLKASFSPIQTHGPCDEGKACADYRYMMNHEDQPFDHVVPTSSSQQESYVCSEISHQDFGNTLKGCAVDEGSVATAGVIGLVHHEFEQDNHDDLSLELDLLISCSMDDDDLDLHSLEDAAFAVEGNHRVISFECHMESTTTTKSIECGKDDDDTSLIDNVSLMNSSFASLFSPRRSTSIHISEKPSFPMSPYSEEILIPNGRSPTHEALTPTTCLHLMSSPVESFSCPNSPKRKGSVKDVRRSKPMVDKMDASHSGASVPFPSAPLRDDSNARDHHNYRPLRTTSSSEPDVCNSHVKELPTTNRNKKNHSRTYCYRRDRDVKTMTPLKTTSFEVVSNIPKRPKKMTKNKAAVAAKHKRFVWFIQSMFHLMYTDQQHDLLKQSKSILEECIYKNRIGDPNYFPLQDTVVKRLRNATTKAVPSRSSKKTTKNCDYYWNLTRKHVGYDCYDVPLYSRAE